MIVNIEGSGPGKVISEIHLRVGKTWGLSTELPDHELGHYKSILAMGSNED